MLFLQPKCLKSNKTNLIHMCVLFIRGRTSTALFYPRQANFYPKNILHFWTMCNSKNPYNPRVFYISRKSALAARRGMCSTHTYHPIFNLPTTSLNHQKSHQNTQKSFENCFDAPSKSPLFSTISSFLKIPQSHRITQKSHPKITKPQIKSTHSRTKTNNPIPTT